MKKTLFAITAALTVLAGCKRIDTHEAAGVGTVNFTLANESNPAYIVKSSLDDVDVNTFKITIKGLDNDFNQTWETFAEMESVMEMYAGTYEITATSPEKASSEEGQDWGEPVFSGTKEFAVKVGAVSNVDLVCSIRNMMVSINATEKFQAEITSYEITVKSADKTLIWTKAEFEAGQKGFFDVAPLEVYVRGTRYNGVVAPEQYLKISDVAAKDHHIINLDANVTGDAAFSISVDNTVVDKNSDIKVPGFEEIPVDGGDDNTGGSTGDNTGEDTPSTAPTMTWESNPNFDVMTITDPMDVVINIEAPETIKEFVVKVESPCATFLSAVGLMISAENDHSSEGYMILDLINDATAGSSLSSLLPTGDALYGQTSVPFALSDLVPLINQMSPTPGDIHTFTLNVTDAKDQTLSQPVKFQTAAE